MRHLGERIGAPAATVSQIEKGERALKEPRIAEWAAALEVSEADLHELWMLSQGQMPAASGTPVFYEDQPDSPPAERPRPDIDRALERRPELESLYRLAERIAEVLNRLLPNERFQVDPDFEDPPYTEGPFTEKEMVANEEWDKHYGLPSIVCYGDPRDPRQPFPEKYLVKVPLLQERTPIVRRRSRSVKAMDLEELIRDLSGPERERVRGYIEAIVEQRAEPEM